LKKPFVATIHGSPRTLQRVFINSPIASWTLGDLGYQIIEFPLHDFTIDRILRGSNHTVVCSFTVLEELKAYRSLDLSKVSVIYNGINFDEIEKIEVSSEDDKDDLSIVFAGRLFWTKGVMLLLEAFRLLKREFSKVQLNIFGKGPLERRIKEFIVNSDLSDSVHCRGFVTRQELLAEVKKSDAVVLPSMSEAQPIFILEAMACKKPLVAFDIPSMREIISDEESGLLAEAFNVNDLYNKIQLLLSDMKLRSRLGQNAFNYVKKEHSWDMQVEKYIQVYENVVMRN
jgi:glycosyltransferase involved in cell wall biosynthesis